MKFRLARDPVVYTNLVAAFVMLVSTFFFPLTPDQQGVVNALAVAIAGAWGAWKVSDGQLALLMGLFKAALAVALAFGLHLSDVQQLTLMTIVAALGAAFVRTQVGSPVMPPPSTAQPVADVSVASMAKRP
jgi:hypothetical protein